MNKGEENEVYVGNLSYNVTEEELRQARAFGPVNSASIIIDKLPDNRKASAVEMAAEADGKAAIED
jgi:RNA recognition motif-containing protein